MRGVSFGAEEGENVGTRAANVVPITSKYSRILAAVEVFAERCPNLLTSLDAAARHWSGVNELGRRDSARGSWGAHTDRVSIAADIIVASCCRLTVRNAGSEDSDKICVARLFSRAADCSHVLNPPGVRANSFARANYVVICILEVPEIIRISVRWRILRLALSFRTARKFPIWEPDIAAWATRDGLICTCVGIANRASCSPTTLDRWRIHPGVRWMNKAWLQIRDFYKPDCRILEPSNRVCMS